MQLIERVIFLEFEAYSAFLARQLSELGHLTGALEMRYPAYNTFLAHF